MSFLGGGSSSGGSPGGGGTKKQAQSYQKKNKTPVKDFIEGGGVTGAVIRGVKKAIKHQKTKNRKSKSGDVYAGEAYGYDEAKEKKDYKQDVDTRDYREGNNQPQGIELAKSSTTSATILGPAEIQKKAANTIGGPTSVEMSADEILLANKRKGRKITNITGPEGLAKKEKLSKKTLLG